MFTNAQFGLATKSLPLEGPKRFRAGEKIGSAPQVDGLATQPLACWGVANASERGKKIVVAHKWVVWRHNPWDLEGP